MKKKFIIMLIGGATIKVTVETKQETFNGSDLFRHLDSMATVNNKPAMEQLVETPDKKICIRRHAIEAIVEDGEYETTFHL